ncbi:hypothetical protein [Rhodococcus sp. OK302]|uniref:hypothetical protein n=1 Tax=Rhodococcus sp. OK302 TaxID=1882769 RepID=UPI000B9F3351|nr:hypothetical protein [Rhodococcus sp. OK302]OYD71354.1 hypothetical protein BDB13_5020 [Rhodococcus sp. OK302]
MKDRTVMIGALTVAGVSVASGLVFGGAAGAFGASGPVVTPPSLVSTVTADSLADYEPAAFYSSIAVSTIAIPPTPTWAVAAEATAPRNQPLTVDLDVSATTPAVPTPTTAPAVTSAIAPTTRVVAPVTSTVASTTRTTTKSTVAPTTTTSKVTPVTTTSKIPVVTIEFSPED